jgi:protein LTV1
MQPKMEGETSGEKLDVFRQGLVKPNAEAIEAASQPKITLTRQVLEEAMPERPVQRKRETWDVQSIISTYSNLENHPSLISDKGPKKKIRIDPKTGMPVLVEVERKQTKLRQENEQEEEEEDEEEDDEEAPVNKGEARSKKESKEDKKARKQALKDEKKVTVTLLMPGSICIITN